MNIILPLFFTILYRDRAAVRIGLGITAAIGELSLMEDGT